MHTDLWQSIGIVAGAILALGALWRKVVVPVWRAFWRIVRRLDQVADDILGDERKGVPSMSARLTSVSARLTAVEETLAAHLSWHGPTLRLNSVPVGRGRHHHPDG